MASPPERGMSGVRTAGVPVMDENLVRLKLLYWETEKNFWDRARRLNPSVGYSVAKISQVVKDIMQLLERVAGIAAREMKVLQPSFQAGVLCAGGAVLGAVVGGRFGAALGGAIGTVAATWLSGDKLESIPEILRKLPRDKMEELCWIIYPILMDLMWTSAEHLITLVLADAPLLNLVKAALASFLIKQLKYMVQYS